MNISLLLSQIKKGFKTLKLPQKYKAPSLKFIEKWLTV